jgi:hypothetical protein
MNFDNLFSDPFSLAFYGSFAGVMLFSLISAQILLSVQKRYKISLKRNKFGMLLVSRLNTIVNESNDIELKRSLNRCIRLLIITRVLFVSWGVTFLILILLIKR